MASRGVGCAERMQPAHIASQLGSWMTVDSDDAKMLKGISMASVERFDQSRQIILPSYQTLFPHHFIPALFISIYLNPNQDSSDAHPQT